MRTFAIRLLGHSLWVGVILLSQLVACGGGGSTAAPTLQSIAVTPTNPTIAKGATRQFKAVGSYSNNATSDITTSVTWGSSNSNVATVGDASGSKGLVTAVTVGTVNITASMGTVSGSSSVDVTPFGLADLTLLDETPGYILHPVVALNNQNMVLVAYEKDGTLLTKFYDGQTWPPSWQTPPVGASNYRGDSDPGHQLVMNEFGAAGMIYTVTSDQALNQDLYRFGFAYFNGTAWSYSQTFDGSFIKQQFPRFGEVRTPTIGIDSNGTVYVAFQKALNGFEVPDVLAIARFNAAGLIDVAEFQEVGTILQSPVGNLYLSVNANDQVMVFNSTTGSRTFNGTTWGQLKPLSVNSEGPAYLNFSNSGSAEFITLVNQIVHYRYDGTSWGTGVSINGGSGAGNGSAAVDSSGNIMVAYMTLPFPSPFEEHHIRAKFFDGATWGPPQDVDNTPGFEANPKMLVDGMGNFVVLFSGYANYFTNGSWQAPIVLEGVDGVLDPAVAMNNAGDFAKINSDGINENLYSMFYTFSP